MTILVTGSSGFIGYHLTKELLKKNKKVIGIDSNNNYYSNKLKIKRSKKLKNNKNFNFIKFNLINEKN